ncbi:SDR family NAD(P)-dependent oxidoreductase [Pontibacter silvestris]|uniref:SDR family NAD(P)-dependent oxidoreductase n=1 Tax=Pontibacter silvestris TaxID=2305183 RepID=A0ABW4WUB7_9BACT|nr:SDR family NAD(P)-dependent oxidoreductase [Pontibacter silvestris]MCC9136994.1 SDR family NAD(P)-dependent oxidoreductase [Pontibacter silvestris]
MDTKKVWLVTGASKGLGLTFVKKLLATGYRVAATSRNVQSLVATVGEASDVFLPLEMSLTEEASVKEVIASCVRHFGQLDVVVNNAGYGLIGTLEELSDEEVKANFDVNVFGSLHVIRHATPYLRQQKSGYIFNIASIGGYTGGFPGFGIYCATKFAVAGFTEALAEEMKAFGVHVSVVYPGYFRTDFLSGGSVKTAATPIAAYESARAVEQAHLQEINGNQPNDPERAAEILIELSELPEPPVHLFLGKDAYQFATQKNELIRQTMADFEALATSTGIVKS